MNKQWNGSIKECCDEQHDFDYIYGNNSEDILTKIEWCKICGYVKVITGDNLTQSKYPYLRELFNDGYKVVNCNLVLK